MLSFDQFTLMTLQEKIDYLMPLFLALPDGFQNSKVIFSYISRGNPSSFFLDTAYDQILDYVDLGKIQLQSQQINKIAASTAYIKKLKQLEECDKNDAEEFLLQGLSNL